MLLVAAIQQPSLLATGSLQRAPGARSSAPLPCSESSSSSGRRLRVISLCCTGAGAAVLLRTQYPAARKRARKGQWPALAAVQKAEASEEAPGEGHGTKADKAEDEEQELLRRRLESMEGKDIDRVCKALDVAGFRRHVKIRGLLHPAKRSLLLSILDPGRRVAPMSLETITQMQKELDRVRRRPKGAVAAVSSDASMRGRALRQQETKKQPLDPDAETSYETCDVRNPIRKSKVPRLSLESLSVGQTLPGHVVALSLLDGLRIDVGAEVDALVPVSLHSGVALFVKEKCSLGAEVEVEVEEVNSEETRRFPLVCSLVRPTWPEATDPNKGRSLRLSPMSASMDVACRADSLTMPELDDWLPESDDLDADCASVDLTVLKKLPPRGPPSEVVSIGPNGDLQIVKVPEQHRSAAGDSPAASEEAKEAWHQYTLKEADRLRYQLRCRDRLAADLVRVEAALASNQPPPVPADLMGMTLLADRRGENDDGRSCLLAEAEGDRLRFRLQQCDSPEALQEWIEERRLCHKQLWEAETKGSVGLVGKAKQEALELTAKREAASRSLAALFACADACHARAVVAAEKEEIRRAGLGYQTRDDSTMEDDWKDMLDMSKEQQAQMFPFPNTPELSNQDQMRIEYFQQAEDRGIALPELSQQR
eukprot:TRINITY_DN37384_c0_g1_i1.p1 TRINITY_DN37384_c0_g1~~TRINITY_DN37384_c0_g1_i1.p1  ORF type:complete len:653 (+),score=171.41 TRINITY_DN37384_c0_g1_i1:63-2021(+)